MGDLAHDTDVAGGDGRYHARLSRDWEIWGPNGGYLAAVLLRAAGAHSGLPRPASLHCHYLGVATFDDVDLTVETIRAGKRSESLRIRMEQGDRPICEALAWVVAQPAEGDGPDHDWATMPAVPAPDSLPSLDERLAAEPEPSPRYRFWENFDYRPLNWTSRAEWEHRAPAEPRAQAWLRFVPTPTFDDPFLDAGRLALLVDTFMWPAAVQAYPGATLPFFAPSMDLSVSFHRNASDEDWLLVDAYSPVGVGDLIGGTASVWTPDGRILASGGQQMLARAVPPPMPKPTGAQPP